MAKNDLVVKLLLDSGAFGNDLRTAERKAQEFSNKMQNAGKTAGDLGKELNITTGAIGKLGGALTGAGAVVAAFGAFKSVMESTHETSKKLHGTLDGISGVFKEIQESLAKMDFTKWNNAASIFQSYKNASISNADLGISQISYDMLNAENMREVKTLMTDFYAATTKEAKEEIKNKMLSTLDTMLGQFGNLEIQIDDNVIKNIIAGSGIAQNLITPEFAKKQIDIVAENLNSEIKTGAKTKDLEYYATVKAELDRLDALIKSVNDSKTSSENSAAQYFGKTREIYLAQAEKYGAESLEYTRQRLEYFNEHIDILFRKQLYDMTAEAFGEISGKRTGADNEGQRLAEVKREIEGLSTEVQQANNGGTEEEIKNVEGSIGWLKDEIAILERKRNAAITGSADWKEHTANIYKYKAALEAATKEQEKYDAQFITTTKPYAEGSIASVQNQITELQKLANTLEVGSVEWRATIALLVKYNGELDEMTKNLKEVQDEMGGTVKYPEEGSLNYAAGKVSEFTSLRNNSAFGSAAWVEANDAMTEWMKTYEKLKQASDGDSNDPFEKIKKKWSNANMVMSSSISVLNALSDTLANSEEESAQKAGAWVDVFSTIGAGVQSYISIMQGAIATDEAYAMAKATGQAATLPFPANIAAIATVVATLTSVIAKINSIKNSAGKFAEGGIVGGTSYSGDKLFAMVNSGEMILNKRQQGNLANMFGGGGQVEFHISGDSLVGVLNNRQNKRNLTR